MKTSRSLLPALVLSALAVPAMAAIRPCATPITVAPGTLPGGTTTLAYTQTLTASGGTAYTFSATKGGLPPGFALTNPTATTIDVTGPPTTPGTFVFTLTARNTDGCSGGRTFSLFVNDRTVVTTTAGTTAFVEDGGAVAVDAGVTVTDTDSANLASATVTIANPQDGAAEVLSATACAGLTVTPGLNSLSITGSQPPAAYQTCLRSVTYNNSSQNPGTTARVLSFVANDGIAGSAAANKTVSVARTDDAPVANAITPPAFNEDTASSISLSYTDAEGDLATACAVSALTNVTVSTPCGCTAGVCTVGVTGTSNYNGAASFSYTVTANAQTSNSATASLTISAVADPPVANPITPPAFDEDVAAVITLSYTDPDGDLATACAVTSPTNVTVSTACACSGAGVCTVGVTGTPLNQNGAASFSYTVTANAQTSNSALASLTITAVNDAPVLGGVAGGFTYTENDAATAIAPGLTVTDVDSTTMSSATITVSANFQSGQDVLSFVNGAGMGNIAGSFAGNVLTLTSAGSTATRAQWETALRAVRYNNSSDDPNTSVRTVTFQINDGAAANNVSNQPSRTITVAAVNDPPTATAFANLPAQAAIPITYPAAKLGGTDLEAGTTITIDLTPINVTNGTVSLNANGSFTFTPLPAATTGSFQYRVSDNGNPAPGVNGAYATVSFTVAGPAIYFVKSAAVGLGNCTLGNECTLATAVANIGVSTNARIFISDANSHASAVPLRAGGWLIGQGVTGTTFDALFGIAAPAQGTLAPRPGLGASRPTVAVTSGTAVTLNSGNSVQGLNITNSGGPGITGSAVGTLTLADFDVTVTGGAALSVTTSGTVTATGTDNDLNSTTGTALNVVSVTIGAAGLTFKSISAGNATAAPDPANGIVLSSTGSTGGLTVTGDAGSANNGSGGSIQNSSGDGISLTSVQSVSFDQLTIQTTGGSGVNGTQVTNFAFTNSAVSGAGNAGFESALAFNGSGSGFGNNIAGVVTVTGNTFTNPFYSGLDVQSDNGTVSSATISNNTITNPGFSGVNLVGTGNAATAFNLTKATINQNNVSSSGGNGVQVSIGNSNATGPGATAGIPGDPTNIIAITNNSVSIDPTGTQAITVANSGGNSGSRTQTNFDISCNGRNTGGCSAPTATPLLGSSIGTVVLIGNNGFATMTGTVNNNAIDANHTPNMGGGNGIAGGNGVAGAGNAWTPTLTLSVTNNTITDVDGNGILLVGRSTSGKATLTITGNNVAVPINVGGSARPGIRVDAGNASSADDAICLTISGNTSAGSNGSEGIGVRKQGTVATTNDFRIPAIGIASPTIAQVETFIEGQNPAGGGAFVINGDAFLGTGPCP